MKLWYFKKPNIFVLPCEFYIFLHFFSTNRHAIVSLQNENVMCGYCLNICRTPCEIELLFIFVIPFLNILPIISHVSMVFFGIDFDCYRIYLPLTAAIGHDGRSWMIHNTEIRRNPFFPIVVIARINVGIYQRRLIGRNVRFFFFCLANNNIIPTTLPVGKIQ